MTRPTPWYGRRQILELVVVGGETGCGRHAVVSPGVGVGQQIVALYLHFRFFGLGHSGLAVAQRGYVSLDACVIYLDNRGVCPCAVRGIVQGEHGLELEVFQEIPLPVHVARATVVLAFVVFAFRSTSTIGLFICAFWNPGSEV